METIKEKKIKMLVDDILDIIEDYMAYYAGETREDAQAELVKYFEKK